MPGRSRRGVRTPPVGSTTPSKSTRSTRAWSWKYSRWRRFDTAHAGATCSDCAQWPEISRPCAGGDARDPQPLGDPGTARDVGLEHVDCPGRAHPLEVRRGRSRTRRRRRRRGDRVADLVQPVEVVGGHRFLEPGDAEVGERRVPAGSPACGCRRRWRRRTARRHRRWPPRDESAHVGRRGRVVGAPPGADLHLHRGNPGVVHPAAELLGELLVGVAT